MEALDINVIDIVGPLDKEPEPKTLQECYDEAGDFPFYAKTIITVGGGILGGTLPVGIEFRFTEVDTTFKDTLRFSTTWQGREYGVVAVGIRRWMLLGHKT